MMRVVQISDTHLSPGKRHFGDNWAPVARWIAAEQPDLVIHTGDVTVEGAGLEEDARWLGGLCCARGVPWLAVLGNHDGAGDARDPINRSTSESRCGGATSATIAGCAMSRTGAFWD